MSTADWQPRLTSRFLILRPLQPSDWPALFGVAKDRYIWEQHPSNDRWQEPVFRRFFDDALASGGAMVAVLPEANRIIGSSRFDPRRAGPGEVEIGWTFLAREHWGGRTNAVMKRMMLEHAFGQVERVIFMVGEGNGRSRRAMEKIGARLTERTYTADTPGAATHVIYAMERAHFESGPMSRTPV